ncbi:MAG: protein-methionine-sulfoxide reductase heme-binding subunit MsrQ [Chloroflexota bacterium]
MTNIQKYLNKNWFWLAVNLAAFTPLLLLIWRFLNNDLGVNPIDSVTDNTGKVAIIMLMLSLACTPLNFMFGWRKVMTVRKSLGLHAFMYAGLHFLTFIGLDFGFNWDLIINDALFNKPYALAGFGAFLILLPLALTSTRYWMKRLGRNWKRLHQAVYVSGILAVLHFIWLVKFDLTEPLIYATILTFLLLARVPPIRKFLRNATSGLRSSGKKSKRPAKKAVASKKVAEA